MLKIGLIKEGKIPADNRVALIPRQCKWIQQNMPVIIKVQHSDTRCFKDKEYTDAGIEVKEDLSDCDVLMGIKEVPVKMLIHGKTYFFFLKPYSFLLREYSFFKSLVLFLKTIIFNFKSILFLKTIIS